MEAFRSVGKRNSELMMGKPSHRKLPEGQWSIDYEACVGCGLTETKHVSNGYCKRCYARRQQAEKTKKKNQSLLETGKDGIDYVICQICKEPFEALLTNGHLKVHALTEEAYATLFPAFPTRSEKMSEKQGASISAARIDLHARRGYLNPENQRISKSIEMSIRHATSDFAKVSASEKEVADWFLSHGYKVVVGNEAEQGHPPVVFWQYNLFGKYCVDFCFPAKEIVIEVAGDWWHGWDYLQGRQNYDNLHAKVKRNLFLDKARAEEIKTRGWTLVTIWEHEINDRSFVSTLLRYFPRVGSTLNESAGEIIIAKNEKVAPGSLIPLSKLVHNHIQRLNARWLETRGMVKIVNSMLVKDEAIKLLSILRQHGDKSIVPQEEIEFEFARARKNGFPYENLSEDEKADDWDRLLRAKVEKIDGMYSWAGRETRLATAFHPHFYSCRRKGKMSPIQFFNSDQDLRRGIMKVICLDGDVTPSRLRNMCRNEDASSPVNNFPPRIVMALLKDVFGNRKGLKLLDPCAGFSGRMIGSATSKQVSRYACIDLSEETVAGLNRTKDFLRLMGCPMDVEVVHGDCNGVMAGMTDAFDVILTSPPFLDVEEYDGVPVERNYSRWVREFVVPFVGNCHNRLAPNGKLIVYSENINARKQFSSDVSDIAASAGFKQEEPVIFKKSRGTYQRLTTKFKPTPIHVWTKM